jgi:hypothetical protein
MLEIIGAGILFIIAGFLTRWRPFVLVGNNPYKFDSKDINRLVRFVSNTFYITAFLLFVILFLLIFEFIDGYIHLYVFVVLGMITFLVTKLSIMINRLKRKYNIRSTKHK